MKTLDVMRRAGRNLQQAKGRTFLTSLAIAVGAFTLTLSLAAGQGARNYADNLLKNNIDPQALFVVKDKNITTTGPSKNMPEYSDDFSTTHGGSQGMAIKMMTPRDVSILEKRGDLTNVVPIYEISARYVTFEGSDKKWMPSLSYYDSSVLNDVAAGSLPKLGEQIADDEILVPQEFAQQLGISDQAMVGKTVTLTVAQMSVSPSEQEITQAFASGGDEAVKNLLTPQTKEFHYRVRAVIAPSTMAFASRPQLAVSTNAAKTLNLYANDNDESRVKFLGVTAIAKHGNSPEVIQESLTKQGYSVQTAKDAQGVLFTFINILQGIVAGFALLALIASVFGIINTQYISVLERTSQIGLMKALGMRRRDIAKLFRYEAAWIGFIGGALGVGLGVLVGWLANPAITKALDFGDQSLLVFVWWQLAILMIALILVAIMAGWFPARKAARLDPIEALRTE